MCKEIRNKIFVTLYKGKFHFWEEDCRLFYFINLKCLGLFYENLIMDMVFLIYVHHNIVNNALLKPRSDFKS